LKSYELVTYSQPRSFAMEAFRILRANLQFIGVGKELKTVMLAAGGLNEGTSLTTANLGIVFAQTGQRVIIVDCDLRKPQQHLIFNVSNQLGLTSVLSGFKKPEEVMINLPVTGVRMVPAGPLPANPTELMGSGEMERLIAGLKEEADVILFDAPPLGVVADAAVLSAKVDGVLLVVRSRLASYSSVLKTKDLLTNAKAKTLGVVLNCVRMDEVIEKYHLYYDNGNASERKKQKKVSGTSAKIKVD